MNEVVLPTTLLRAVARTFDELEWAYVEVPERSVLEADFSAYHGRVRFHAQVFEEVRLLSMVSQLDRLVPEVARGKMGELLMRLNLELSVGNYEMDWDEGRVMFRTTGFFGERVEASVIASLAHTAVAEMDRLIPLAALVCRADAARLAMMHLPSLMKRKDLWPNSQAAKEG